MRQKFFTSLGCLILSLLFAAFCWGGYVLIKSVHQGLSTLPKEVAAAIVAGTCTVLISVISVLLSKYIERRAEINRQLREKKLPIYEELVTFLFSILMAEKSGRTPPTEQEVARFFGEHMQKLMVWGSDGVVKAVATFRTQSATATDEASRTKVIFNFENLLLEIRKDMGHTNWGLSKGDVLSLFINDIGKHLK